MEISAGIKHKAMEQDNQDGEKEEINEDQGFQSESDISSFGLDGRITKLERNMAGFEQTITKLAMSQTQLSETLSNFIKSTEDTWKELRGVKQQMLNSSEMEMSDSQSSNQADVTDADQLPLDEQSQAPKKVCTPVQMMGNMLGQVDQQIKKIPLYGPDTELKKWAEAKTKYKKVIEEVTIGKGVVNSMPGSQQNYYLTPTGLAVPHLKSGKRGDIHTFLQEYDVYSRMVTLIPGATKIPLFNMMKSRLLRAIIRELDEIEEEPTDENILAYLKKEVDKPVGGWRSIRNVRFPILRIEQTGNIDVSIWIAQVIAIVRHLEMHTYLLPTNPECIRKWCNSVVKAGAAAAEAKKIAKKRRFERASAEESSERISSMEKESADVPTIKQSTYVKGNPRVNTCIGCIKTELIHLARVKLFTTKDSINPNDYLEYLSAKEASF